MQPTFGMYSFLATSMGMKVINSPRKEDWSIDLIKTVELINEHNSKMLLLHLQIIQQAMLPRKMK